MNYSQELKNKTKENLEKIVKYIEENIIPHINYDYETPVFGPIEKWGRWNENKGQRLTIALNHNNKQIIFYHGGIPYSVEDLTKLDSSMKYAVWFLEYWQDAKCYMNTEIQNNNDSVELINNFEI